jgi:CelD/BcsL family acetyltransferase involved in cellulose biosynthesis
VIGAGVLAFRLHRHMPVWHSAADAAFFEMGATQLLYLNMIGDAAREGYASLDFLGSAGLEGVETFKTHFGTQPKSYESFLNRSGLIGRLAGLRDSLRAA